VRRRRVGPWVAALKPVMAKLKTEYARGSDSDRTLRWKREDMGVTIHFEGRLKSKTAFEQLVFLARKWARREGWPIHEIPNERRTLHRVKNETDWDYSGFTEGVVLQPHHNSEPLRLEFDEDLYIQEFIKTQFAGPAIHLQVVAFLKDIQPCFDELTVTDEGEFWESCDKQRLVELMEGCNRALKDILTKNPKARGPIRLPSGRIADCTE
jgi:hypothetical protein